MKLVKNNPYRIAGLLVGATAKEQTKQINKLKMYIEAEQDPQDDFCFPALGNIHRTVENIAEAASKLNLDNDKMCAALFWFYKGNAITDEPAFDSLKNGGIKEAATIWGKLAIDKEITTRNASAFFNWGTLFLNSAFHNKDINEKHLESGIDLKMKFLESDFINDFKSKATDETFKASKKEIQLSFLNSLQQEIEKHGGLSASKFIEILSRQNFAAKEEFLKSFVQKPIEQIQNKIEAAKAKRKANKASAANAGNELYNSISSELIQLKNILGSSDLKYSSISDKVSDELLQCGIDYFKHYRDSSTDPGSVSMDLFRKAKTCAEGNIAKQRCLENTENLQKWINEKPEREKQARIKVDLDGLIEIFQEFDDKSETIENAKSIINRSKPKLANIKSNLSANDDLYLKLSTRVAMQAQSFIVEEVNEAQQNLDYKIAIDRYRTINNLKNILSNAWSATTLIGTLDMEYDFKVNHYNRNKEALRGLCNQLGVSTSGYSSSSSTGTTSTYRPSTTPASSSGSSWAEENPGCLIALIIGAIFFLIAIFSS